MRVMLIHAMHESMAPIHRAFAQLWPEARIFDVLDSSLAVDHAADAGRLGPKMVKRFRVLGRYAAAAGPEGAGSDAVLFTCSAFGGAIDAVKRDRAIPVLRPNEAAFTEALKIGSRIAVLVSFEPSRGALAAELAEMAHQRGQVVEISAVLVADALAALQAGDGAGHDRAVAHAAASLQDVDVIVLGQFSMARAAEAVRAAVSVPVLTTPESAVTALRALLAP